MHAEPRRRNGGAPVAFAFQAPSGSFDPLTRPDGDRQRRPLAISRVREPTGGQEGVHAAEAAVTLHSTMIEFDGLTPYSEASS